MTVDENENHPRELKFCTSINLSVYIKIQVNLFFISAVVSYQQLSTADDSTHINFSVQMKIPVKMFAKP